MATFYSLIWSHCQCIACVTFKQDVFLFCVSSSEDRKKWSQFGSKENGEELYRIMAVDELVVGRVTRFGRGLPMDTDKRVAPPIPFVFFVYFLSFQTNSTILTTNRCEKVTK